MAMARSIGVSGYLLATGGTTGTLGRLLAMAGLSGNAELMLGARRESIGTMAAFLVGAEEINERQVKPIFKNFWW